MEQGTNKRVFYRVNQAPQTRTQYKQDGLFREFVRHHTTQYTIQGLFQRCVRHHKMEQRFVKLCREEQSTNKRDFFEGP